MTACIAEDSEFYTSTVTDAEFLVKPFSDNDFEKAKQYKLLQEKFEVLKCFISEEIAEKAAHLRSVYADIKLADALQLASSMNMCCDSFLTNDKQLKQVKEAHVQYIGDL